MKGEKAERFGLKEEDAWGFSFSVCKAYVNHHDTNVTGKSTLNTGNNGHPVRCIL